MQQAKNTDFDYIKTLRAIAKENKRALQQLFEHESDNLFSFAYKILRHYSLAEDTLVKTFTLIWENAQYYEAEQGPARGWIYCIFRYHLNQNIERNYAILKEVAKEQHKPLLCDVCPNLHAGVHDFVEPGCFYQVFEELPEETQRVMISMYFSGQSQAATATALDMPLGRLKENIQLGLRHLSAKRQDLQVKHHDVIAIGEFVLGGLDQVESDRVIALFSHDTEAEKLCYIWEDELTHFLNQLVLETPPASAWVRVKQAILPAKSSTIDNTELSDELSLSQTQSPQANFQERFWITLKKCWISRNFWRWCSAASVALLALLLVYHPFENPLKATAVLQSTFANSDTVGFVITQKRKTVITALVTQQLDNGMSLQLWQQDAQNQLRSIAILDGKSSQTLDTKLHSGDTFLISIEPSGGSKTGLVTGQILFRGKSVEF